MVIHEMKEKNQGRRALRFVVHFVCRLPLKSSYRRRSYNSETSQLLLIGVEAQERLFFATMENRLLLAFGSIVWDLVL